LDRIVASVMATTCLCRGAAETWIAAAVFWYWQKFQREEFHMSRFGSLCSIFVWLLPLAAMAAEYGTVARVNGVDLGAARFDRYYQEFLVEKGRNIGSIRNPDVFRKLREEAMDAYIDDELLWQEAARRGDVATASEVDAGIDRLKAKYGSADEFTRMLERGGHTEESIRELLHRQISSQKYVELRLVPKIKVSDQEIHKYYRANRARFDVPEQVRVRHILILLPQDASSDQTTEARSLIARVLTEARKPGADFAALARQFSQDGSAAQGGDIGFIGRGQTVPAFEQAAFAMRDGQVSDVVQTEFGLHVLRREAFRQGILAEADVRESIKRALGAEKRRLAIRRHLDELKRKAKIERKP
jgi:parvulin-like peptidyl-prolyl isomerase